MKWLKPYVANGQYKHFLFVLIDLYLTFSKRIFWDTWIEQIHLQCLLIVPVCPFNDKSKCLLWKRPIWKQIPVTNHTSHYPIRFHSSLWCFSVHCLSCPLPLWTGTLLTEAVWNWNRLHLLKWGCLGFLKLACFCENGDDPWLRTQSSWAVSF